jgi:hypothetical protein
VRKLIGFAGAIIAAILIAACGGRITDPGPVDDAALNHAVANAALVNGMAKSLSRALGYISYTGAAASREVVGSGSTALFGITVKQRSGLLDPAFAETNDHWQFAQQARWIAEDGVRRMRLTLGDDFAKSPLAAEALIYVGFSNRLLGENMCDGVIDGGPKQPRRVYLDRADAAFTEAIAVATAAGNQTLLLAARAGRASVRLGLGSYTAAADDARTIPATFRYQAKYTATELDQYNRVYWSNANQPYRAHSVVGTFYESYYQTTGDPRTVWQRNPAIPTGTQANVPWLFQMKFDKRDAPVNLASGREMRLIVAESQLRAGDWPGAVATMNQTRSELGITLWSASSAVEAWVALKRERGIELWLEGRRLGDLHRWLAESTPGAVEDMTGRNTCFPIGQNELDANTNL